MKESPAVASLRAQIQRIAFDANIYDRGIGDYPYAEKCSRKRKVLLAEIARLQGETVEMPRKRAKSQNTRVFGQTQGQLTMFGISDTPPNPKKRQKP